MKKYTSQIVFILSDITSVYLAIFIGLLTRFEWHIPDNYLSMAAMHGIYFSAIFIALFFAMGLYRILWEYAGSKQFLKLIGACIFGILMITLIEIILPARLPLSVLAIQFLAFLLLTGGIRVSRRMIHRALIVNRNLVLQNKSSVKRVMIVGAGDAGLIIIKEILFSPIKNRVPAVMVDDDINKQGRDIYGTRIEGGCERIPEIAKKYGIHEIVLAIPSLDIKNRRKILKICCQTECEIKIMPLISEIHDHNYFISSLNKVARGSKIYLSSPHMSDEDYEMQYILEAFSTNWIAPLGKNVNEFENEMAKYVNIGHAAALSSGTAAIHMALKATGVGAGDIVFCPSLTFAATANPIIYQNAIPVFIDSDYKTWNMSPIALEKAFEKYTPKAVLVVHLYGLSAEMDQIIEICKEHNVALIEDAAESLGTLYKGKHTGTLGDYGIFSFNGNKIITASTGGMLVSNNEEKIAKVIYWATQARDPARYYLHSELGFNYRMSNIIAGIGRGQLKVLDQRVQEKRNIFNFYKRELDELKDVEMMPVNNWNEPNYWLSCMTLSGKVRPLDIMEALEAKNIESRPIWKPMHTQPFFEKYDFIGEGVSEEIFKNGVCLPSDTNMTEEELKRVVKIIKGLWR